MSEEHYRKCYWIEVLRPNKEKPGENLWTGDVIRPLEDESAARHTYQICLRTIYGEYGLQEGQHPVVRLVSADFGSDGSITNYRVEV